MKFLSKSPTETKKIAAKLASKLKPGAVLGLVGDLGSGKTYFTKGLAQYFQIKKNITSPTFVLLKIYNLACPERSEGPCGKKDKIKKLPKNYCYSGRQIKFLVHVDCYRLNHPDELLAIGLQEFLQDKNCLVVIEWADKIKKLLPQNTIWIKFGLSQKENERKIEIKNKIIKNVRPHQKYNF